MTIVAVLAVKNIITVLVITFRIDDNAIDFCASNGSDEAPDGIIDDHGNIDKDKWYNGNTNGVGVCDAEDWTELEE